MCYFLYHFQDLNDVLQITSEKLGVEYILEKVSAEGSPRDDQEEICDVVKEHEETLSTKFSDELQSTSTEEQEEEEVGN